MRFNKDLHLSPIDYGSHQFSKLRRYACSVLEPLLRLSGIEPEAFSFAKNYANPLHFKRIKMLFYHKRILCHSKY